MKTNLRTTRAVLLGLGAAALLAGCDRRDAQGTSGTVSTNRSSYGSGSTTNALPGGTSGRQGTGPSTNATPTNRVVDPQTPPPPPPQ